jgi:trehalose 6-phosphate synthase/phosphatase
VRTRTITPKIITRMLVDYEAKTSRLLLLDYDGTLVPFTADYEDAKPPKRLRQLLQKLADDERNQVVVISGRSRDDLDSWLGDLRLNLIAEHGVYSRKAGARNWINASKTETTWKTSILPILETYTAKTPLAEIEEKGHSLVWHYRQSPPYYAQKYAVIIKRVLRPLIKKYQLEIFNGNKILEIRDPLLNKGSAIRPWLASPHNFILAIGDDYTDEDMFKVLPIDSFRIKVGLARTRANYRVASSAEVEQLLKRLSD